MDDLKPLAIFAETVAAGSMSAAARRLGMSPSAVSQAIRALEEHGGVTLLHRSTRKLALTEAGERYYPHCKRLLDAAHAAADSLQQSRDAPTGELRVAAPVGFTNHVAPALAPLLAEAEQLRLCLLVDDAMIDLIDARVDLAIRVGKLADSNWVARRLCEFEVILCASPEYLERHGMPAAPADLAGHQWLAFERESRNDAARGSMPIALDLHDPDGAHQHIDIEPRIVSNNQIALQQMCEQGMGIARLGHADVYPRLQQGALVRVLSPWQLPSLPVWAVTPKREGEAAKVRFAVAYLKRYFLELPGCV
jgi:DNA-binding transcriptional LysR family regulator